MEELIIKLGIDWKLLTAQAVNFAILVYILHRFVFKPLVASLAAREETIKKSIDTANEVQDKLRETQALREEVLAQARRDSDKIIKSAENSALTLKEDELNKAKIEVDKMIAHGEAKLNDDRVTLRVELKKELGELMSLAIEKTVGDIVGVDTQKKLADEALDIMKHSHSRR